MTSPIAFALDFPTLGQAVNFVNGVDEDGRGTSEPLYPHLGAVKVGLELFISAGPRAVKVWDEFGLPVILDLKLHDIPETVERAVKAGGELGVKYMTVHIQQRKALIAAVKAAEPFGITLLGVTMLTSMTERDCQDLRYDSATVERRVLSMVGLGVACGLRGFVCSPQEVAEVAKIRMMHPNTFLLVPGVRPAGSEAGDQKRVGTPRQAVQDGASMIVVGRPIRDAPEPYEATKGILAELEADQC
jgi:orotidine-5'-phosphate decarboxylase